MSKNASLFLTTLALLTLAGCGGEVLPPVYEIEGTVTLNGEPLDRISVEFVPADNGPHSLGTTDENGRFVMTTYDQQEQKGVQASSCKVVLRDNSVFKEGIENLTPSQKRGMSLTSGKKSRIAAKYSNFMTTTLEYKVVGEDKAVEFKVEPREK